MKILIACEYSGIVRDAFIRKGHEAVSCDLLATDSPGPHYHGDFRDILSEGWDMAIFHTPCTRLANSGVRWLNSPPKGKTLSDMWEEFEEGIELYLAARNANIKKKALENPVMHKYARERLGYIRRHIVQPWWFGEKAFKATGFELHGLPDLIPTEMLTPPRPGTIEHKKWSFIHRAPPGPDRWKIRSKTFDGVANAMAQQWG